MLSWAARKSNAGQNNPSYALKGRRTTPRPAKPAPRRDTSSWTRFLKQAPVPSPPPPSNSDTKLTLLAAVHELAGVDALSGDEQLRPLLKPVRIPEDDLGEGCAAARVVDDVLRAEGT